MHDVWPNAWSTRECVSDFTPRKSRLIIEGSCRIENAKHSETHLDINLHTGYSYAPKKMHGCPI